VIELAALGSKAGFDIAQAFSIGELRECHAPVLVLAGKTFDMAIAIVSLNASTQRMKRKMIDCLRKDQFACEHEFAYPKCGTMENRAIFLNRSSSR